MSLRSWTCPCRAILDRDVNAAINILAAGRAESLNACGAQVRRAVVQRAAVHSTSRLADKAAQARAHRSLANAYTWLGAFGAAEAELRLGLELTVQADDHVGQAHTYHVMAYVSGRQGHHAEALDHARHALDLQRANGHRSGEALALNAVGWYHALIGNYRQAIDHCRQALALHQELGNSQHSVVTVR